MNRESAKNAIAKAEANEKARAAERVAAAAATSAAEKRGDTAKATEGDLEAMMRYAKEDKGPGFAYTGRGRRSRKRASRTRKGGKRGKRSTRRR